MAELMMEPGRLATLREQLVQLCSRVTIEEDLLTIRTLLDNFLYKKEPRNTEDWAEEFGSTRFDFDEWMHDPGK